MKLCLSKEIQSSFDEFSPIVTTSDNFDYILIPPDHPARKRTDTYYYSEDRVLRTHTTAHWRQLIADGHRRFLVTGDVYRKDEIDRTHYPVFHQTEGVFISDDPEFEPERSLKQVLSELVGALFPRCDFRFNDDYFPFTQPSFEVEVMFQGKWLEVLGCGVIRPEILLKSGISGRGWAFGLGLERLAMILFDIPDIRLFWTEDPGFLRQFAEGVECRYAPYPSLPQVTKDLSFWIDRGQLKQESAGAVMPFSWDRLNDFYELVREHCGDAVARVELIDRFYHRSRQRFSHTFRLTFAPTHDCFNPGEFNESCNRLISALSQAVADSFGVIIR
ncbi:MAG: tRNA ligase subunit PheS family protein [Sulfobacillus sp.]